jgi:carotenoid 1,2-hydratase
MPIADIPATRALWSQRTGRPRDHGRDDTAGLRAAFPGDGGGAVRAGFPRLDGTLPAPEFPFSPVPFVPRGRQYAPGSGGADGDALGEARRTERFGGPRFDLPVPHGGYSWWYLDALSHDGAHGITIIAFIGSVFSPYYAGRRRRAGVANVDPLAHCALNVALYGKGGHRWAMTERDGRADVRRAERSLVIGPSAVTWDGNAYLVHINEVTMPFPSPIPHRLQGTVRLTPAALVDGDFDLDEAGCHRWRPLAPCAHVEVDLPRPGLKWSGAGYLDMNSGSAPLERDFLDWSWSRATLKGGTTAILYDVTRRSGSDLAVAIKVDPSGRVEDVEPPPRAGLPSTLWRIARETRADAGCGASVTATFEDGPFYARSLLSTHILGERVPAVHETLSLDRFQSRWVQFLLPFKMPRRAGW